MKKNPKTISGYLSFFMLIAIGILITALMLNSNFEKKYDSKNNKITVTNIHEHVVYGGTTKKDLYKMYGRPRELNNNVSVVNRKFDDLESKENSVNESLDNYWNTMKVDKKSSLMNENENYQYYIEYSGKNLGINYVRFFFWNGKVYGIQFGNKIFDNTAARKEKYLKYYFEK